MKISNIILKIRILLVTLETLDKGIKGKVSNCNFTIVSNNCWGAEVYRELQIRYETPFIGLFIYPDDYIKMLENFTKYMGTSLKFTNKVNIRSSKPKCNDNSYPIGNLGDIKIHFQHYKSEKEAKIKWEKRVKRINYKNIYFEYSDRDGINTKLYNRFLNLPFKNKVCFVSSNKYLSNETVFIKESENDGKVMDGKTLYVFCKKYFNLANWLNK